MKKKWSTLFYILILIIAGAVIYWIVKQGRALQNPALTIKEMQAENQSASKSSFQEFTGAFSSHITDPLSILLLQIIVIIAFARLFGFLFKKIGQPAVIGEIVAGIILGPSIMGLFFPAVNHFLFPPKFFGNIRFS